MAGASLNPYIQLQDQAREAMEFYRSVFGGELAMDTFASMGMSGHPSNDDRIMHAQLVTDLGMVLMASDVPDGVPYEPGSRMSIAINGDDEALPGYFEALAESGTVVEPLAAAPWGDTFGMCVDRFGIGWMFNIGTAQG